MKNFLIINLVLFFTIIQSFNSTSAVETNKNNTVQYNPNQTSIYSFLKENNLTPKSRIDFYNAYSDSINAKKLYDFFIENELSDNNFSEFHKRILAEKLFPEKPISYKDFSIKIKNEFPEYKDVDDLELTKKMVEKYPVCKDNVLFEKSLNIVGLHKYLSKKDGFTVPLEQFKTDMENEQNVNKLYHNLRENDDFTLSLNHFKSIINESHETIQNGTILYFEFFIAEPSERLNILYNYLEERNPEIRNHGFKSFCLDMGNDTHLKKVYDGFSAKYPEWQDLGFETFKKKLLFEKESKKIYPQKNNSFVSNFSFQIDKIKVGNSNIELPFPSGFVKVDDSMGNLLETAKKLCPEINTLLAYYISQEDYASYLVDENHVCEKYILVEVYKELKDVNVGAKDYKQFLKKHKEEYVDNFKLKIDDTEIKASENLSKIDERIKMQDFEMEPFGICYESKYSLSYGILSKYQFSVDNSNSENYVVAALSTVTRIDNKPIFLFLYKTYHKSDDIQSLKALNTIWIEEIEKSQNPGNFLSEIDFEDYKESILAILTLSFIWAIYFATKKIHRKIKAGSETKVIKDDEMKEFFDFNELLHEDKKINDEPEVEENVLESKTNEEIKNNSFIVVNPELLKVNRRTRFYNWLIDAVIFYFIIYLPLFYYNTVSNYYLYLGILFLYYFIQEFLFGKTIGKFITKTYVINSLGVKPTILQLILRNASRLIPFEALTYLSKEKRGLHDIFSKTYVIKD